MARQQQIKPMPFPGESPTVALAMAAGEKFGLHEEKAKPARKGAKKKAAPRKKAATATRKAAPKRKASASRKKAAR